jgi:hypothetical protein
VAIAGTLLLEKVLYMLLLMIIVQMALRLNRFGVLHIGDGSCNNMIIMTYKSYLIFSAQ